MNKLPKGRFTLKQKVPPKSDTLPILASQILANQILANVA